MLKEPSPSILIPIILKPFTHFAVDSIRPISRVEMYPLLPLNYGPFRRYGISNRRHRNRLE